MKHLLLHGILGGTFNPPHYGHIRPLLSAVHQLKLDKVGLMPCYLPPHKTISVNKQHRLAMLSLLCETDPRLYIEMVEIEAQRVSYSIDSLTHLHQRHPDSAIVFFMGYDAFQCIDQWKDWKKLNNLCHMVILKRRTQTTTLNSDIEQHITPKLTDDVSLFHNSRSGLIYYMNEGLFDASSTDIRNKVSNQLNIDELLPDNIVSYIRTHRLYQ